MQLRHLNDANFTYLLKMSPDTGIEVKMSLDDGKNFKTVFDSKGEDLYEFISVIPKSLKTHFAVW